MFIPDQILAVRSRRTKNRLCYADTAPRILDDSQTKAYRQAGGPHHRSHLVDETGTMIDHGKVNQIRRALNGVQVLIVIQDPPSVDPD